MVGTYFLVSVATLTNYGVNWDEAAHSIRGQAYLYYFLTGKKHYDQSLFRDGNRYSFYQILSYDFEYQVRKDGDHPVVSDILSSFFNYIFYQKFGLVGDFEAYHLYGVVLVTIFLIFIYWWVEKFYGGVAALISVLALITYPLFFGESHFNVQKDIPEAVYLISAALSFYMAYVKRSVRWMVMVGLLSGAAIGTKLNIIFLIPAVGLWVLLIGWKNFWQHVASAGRKFPIALFSVPLIAFAVFYLSWPWLWQDPINNIVKSLGYYRSIGIVSQPSFPPQYYVLGFVNTYAAQWVLFTTPLVTLILVAFGILRAVRSSPKETNKVSLYVLILFLVPIARVSLTFTGIYGGVRQIMEYIPPMAILAGIGASWIVRSLVRYFVAWVKIPKRKQVRIALLFQGIVILSFLPISLKMISMHPNESTYFNSLIGGLKGAAERNIPGWGNSLGSTYRQGVRWLNAYAEEGARVAFAFELMSSIPNVEFRPDIQFSNLYRSGPKMEGEYIIGITHEGDAKRYFNYRYSQRFLIPLYQVMVDGVPILKVWKNDIAHADPEILKEGSSIRDIKTEIIGDKVFIEFPKVVRLRKITVLFREEGCEIPAGGQVFMSNDGQSWAQSFSGTLLESASYNWLKHHIEKGKLQYLFPDDRVRYLKITGNDETSCLRKYPIRVEAEGIE